MSAAPSHLTAAISLVVSKPLLIVSVLEIAQILSWVIGGLSVGLLTAVLPHLASVIWLAVLGPGR
jgi:hypothetical protein